MESASESICAPNTATAKTYAVKELYYTLQGEGAHTGRAAVFLRFAGCNLWSGREEDRSTATCQFCDTDFIGTDGPNGGKFRSADDLANAVSAEWQSNTDSITGTPCVVCTGGEPLLQLDETLIVALQSEGFEVAIETNGTLPAPRRVNWICCSPKAGADMVLQSGNELKLVYPQSGHGPEDFADLDFEHFFLQPMDGADTQRNIQLAIDYCQRNPLWRLSIQTHKLIGLR